MKKIFKINKVLPLVLIMIIALALLLGTVFTSNSTQKAFGASGNWENEDFPDLNSFKALIEQKGSSENDPIEISSNLELAYLSYAPVTDINNKYFIITADLNMGAHYFTPIGSINNQVEGIVFDGSGHAIENLTIENDVNGTGLFGSLYQSTIKNLKLENADITSSAQNTGAAAGTANSCNFENITVSGTVKGSMDGLGGIAGAVSLDTSFINCINYAAITASTGRYTGGIFGAAYSGNILLENCQNNGEIKGITYVAGIGSGGSNSSAKFDLKQCSNTRKIESVLPIYDYFAGLIAYTSTNYTHSMEYCYNTGEIFAPNGEYTAGLCAYGRFNITNSYNTGNVTGANLAAGIAADGIFEITKSYNSGAVKAIKNTGNVITAGIAARLISGFVTGSYNKGEVQAVHTGISAGLIGSYTGTPGTYEVVNDCYNWGIAANAFIGESINCASVVTNSYNRGSASVTANAGITHTDVYNYPGSLIPGDIYINLSNKNPAPWGSDTDYNDGYPYLRSGWVSEIVIDLNGGEFSVNGFKLFYVNDLNAPSLDLTGIGFSKSGYKYTDLTEENFEIDDISNIKYDKQLKIITANYLPKEYSIIALKEGDGSVEKTGSDTITFDSESDIVLTAILNDQAIDNFTHWAVEIEGNVSYIFSDKKPLVFNKTFINELILNYPNDGAEYKFVACFGEYRKVDITIIGGSKGLDTLMYCTENPDNPANFTPIVIIGNSFRITLPISTTDVYFKLTAKDYYKIQIFSISGTENDFYGTQNDYEQIIRVSLNNDIEISIVLAKETYRLEIVSRYPDNDDYNPTNPSLILPGSILFAIDQTIQLSEIEKKIIKDVNGYRFMGFVYQNADGSVSDITVHNLDSIDAEFLAKYLNNRKVVIVALYKRQFKINAIIENGDLGKVTLNDGSASEITIYNGFEGYFDEGASITITVKAEVNCEIAKQTGTTITVLNGDAEIYVAFEKKKFKVEVYGINQNNEKIDLDGLKIALPELDSDNNRCISYGSTLYIYNIIGHLSNQITVGWFYETSNGELVPVDISFIDIDGNLLIENITMPTINLWLDGGNIIKIAAKVSDSFYVDINLSDENQKRGDYKIEIKYEDANEFVEVDKSKNIFKINSTIRITVYANEYFEFEKFEDSLGNPVGADGSLSYEFTLSENTIISIYFNSEPVAFSNKKTLVGNGKVDIVPSGKEPDKLQIGDSIVISYSADSNHQIKSIIINELTISDILEKLNAQKIGDSLVVEVDKNFLEWLSSNNGEIDVIVTTEFSKLLLTVLISSAAVLLLLMITAILLYRSNVKRRRQLAIIQAQHARTKAGYDAVQQVEELVNENKLEQEDE